MKNLKFLDFLVENKIRVQLKIRGKAERIGIIKEYNECGIVFCEAKDRDRYFSERFIPWTSIEELD